MLGEVDLADRAAWRSLGNSISAGLRDEILHAPVGDRIRELLDNQVVLIRSIPIKAGERVHELTVQALEDGTRAREIAKDILDTGNVTQSRANLIARTEVSRTASTLVQSRSEYVGSLGYAWRTARDGAVRTSHKKMEAVYVPWNKPVTLDGMTGHAGCFPGCRCYPEPIIADD